MELINLFKFSIKAILRTFGLELRRVTDFPSPAPLFDDPLEVIRKINSHESAALNCPLRQCVTFNGMPFSRQGWHPLVKTASDYINTGIRSYEGSLLERYYRNWQPKNARDALIGAINGPSILDDQPAYLKHTPWSHRDVEERASYMSQIINIENSIFGGEFLTPSDGYGLHGPVSYEKGELEYNRLIDLVDSIKKQGFDRNKEDISVEVLKKENEIRYVIVHGHHRAAVMAALGYDFIPVIPLSLIEEKYVEHWPSVYKNIWTREEALAYFYHLFDFDSLSWAKERNLL